MPRAVVVAFLLVASIPAHAADQSWVGKRIMTKNGKVDLLIVDANDQWQVGGKTKDAISIVEKEDGHWIKIRNMGVSGWIDKKDVVLVEDAVDYFTDRIRGDPKKSAHWHNRGIAWYERGEYDIAIKDFDEAIRLDPNDGVEFNSRGNAWSRKEDYDRAIKDYDEAIRLDPKYALAFRNRGLAWQNKKDYDSAIKDYDEAIRLDPKYALAFNNRAYAWWSKKDYDKAIKDYDEAIRLDLKDALAFTIRGNDWLRKKDYDRAIKDYDEAIRLEPKYSKAFYNRGLAWQNKKDYDRAIKDYDDAIRLDPKYAPACNNKAYVLASCNDDAIRDVAKAKQLMITVHILRPTSPYNEETLGVIAAAEGRFEDAIKHQKNALDDKNYAERASGEAHDRLKAYEEKKPFRQ